MLEGTATFNWIPGESKIKSARKIEKTNEGPVSFISDDNIIKIASAKEITISDYETVQFGQTLHDVYMNELYLVAIFEDSSFEFYDVNNG